MIELTKADDVHVITMNNGPNMIDPDWQVRMIEVLEAVEADCQGDAGLVLTGKEKFFSNGLNVEIVMGLSGDDPRYCTGGESCGEGARYIHDAQAQSLR